VVFIEWRKIKGKFYAYARIAEWNRDCQRSKEEQIYLGSTLEKATEKLLEVATKRPRLNIDVEALSLKLRNKHPG
jgi:hypothetical protein